MRQFPLIVFIILGIFGTGIQCGWLKYTEDKYISMYPLQFIKLPDSIGLFNITHVSELSYYYAYHIFLIGTSVKSIMYNGVTNQIKQIRIYQNYTHLGFCIHTLKGQISISRTTMISTDSGQKVLDSMSQDYSQFIHKNIYFVNTTKKCKIRLQLSTKQNHHIYILAPEDLSHSAPRFYQSNIQGSLKIIEQQIPYGGLWGIGIQKTQEEVIQEVSVLKVYHDSQSPCQNLCYGQAINRGSKGWNLFGKECLCEDGYYSNPYFGCGSVDCSIFLGFSQKSPDQCICQGQEIWDPSYNYCISSICPPKYKMSNQTQNCELRCGTKLIPYSLTNGQNNSCTCKQKYKWSAAFEICYLQCGTNSIPNSIQSSDKLSQSCICMDKYYWSSSQQACILSCGFSIIPYSVSLVNSITCECQQKYLWDYATKQCLLGCGNPILPFSVETENTDEGCDCLQGYYWHKAKKNCYCLAEMRQTGQPCLFSCSVVPYAFSGLVKTGKACQCWEGYQWNSSELSCELACNRIFDKQKSANGEYCICQKNTYWSPELIQCVGTCQDDILSIGTLESGECACTDQSEWNEEENRCSCIEGYKLSPNNLTKCVVDTTSDSPVQISFVSLGIFIGIATLGIMLGIGHFIKYKKQKKMTQSPIDSQHTKPHSSVEQVYHSKQNF